MTVSDFVAQTLHSLREISTLSFICAAHTSHRNKKAYGFSSVNSTSGAFCMDGQPNSCYKSPKETSGVIHLPLCCRAPGLDCNEDVQLYSDILYTLLAAL